jgi:hypothetical protein
VENELALTGNFEPVERTGVVDADLVRTIEKRFAGQCFERKPLLLDATQRIRGCTPRAVAKVVPVLAVHGFAPFSTTGLATPLQS